jgi:hypothetical protein
MIIPVRSAVFALLLMVPCVGCSESGLTAIEIPIVSLEITNGCTVMIEGSTCTVRVIAMTEDGQSITNPVLRWFSNSSSVAVRNDRGLIEAVAPGAATVTVSNSTGTVSDATSVTVFPNTGGK